MARVHSSKVSTEPLSEYPVTDKAVKIPTFRTTINLIDLHIHDDLKDI